MKALRYWGARLALAGISTIVSLVLIEAVLRWCRWPIEDPVWVTCPETGFRFAPNLRYRQMSSEYDVDFSTNAFGLRNDEIGPKRGFRVLLLGDSFACGYGVERRDTFADLLRQQLGVDLINAGIGGFEIIQQVQYYRTEGRKFQPDLTVYALYVNNDLTNNRLWQSTAGGALERRNHEPPIPAHGTPKLLCLLKRSIPVRRAWHACFGRFERSRLAKPGTEYLRLCAEPLDETAREDFRLADALLRQLRDEVLASGSQFLVIGIPLRAVVEEPRPEAYAPQPEHPEQTHDLLRPVRWTADCLRRGGIEYVSLAEPLRAQRMSSPTPLYFPCDGHLNAAGHRAVAECVLPVLAAKVQAVAAAPSCARPGFRLKSKDDDDTHPTCDDGWPGQGRALGGGLGNALAGPGFRTGGRR